MTKEQETGIEVDNEIEEDEEGDIATDYEIQISEPDREMRIVHRDEDGVISSMILTSDEAYTYAQRILRGYDKLEGL